MKVARIGSMRHAFPPSYYGGTERSMVQMTIYQAATCAHDITLYGPTESEIINYADDISKKLCLATEVDNKLNKILIRNADDRIGSIKLRTTGHKAIGYESSNNNNLNDLLFNLLIEDENKSPFDIIHCHLKNQAVKKLFPGSLGYKTLVHNHGTLLNEYKTYHFPIICISHSQARILKKKYGAIIYDVIHHGLDPFTYKATSEHAGYLAWVGRFMDRKGAFESIMIAKKVEKPLIIAGTIKNYYKNSERYFDKKIKPNIDIIDLSLLDRISGFPANQIKHEIKLLCDQAGTTSPIIYVGPVNDNQKQILLGNALGTLFPVKWNEPFGRVMIESMACGTPVIGYTRVGTVFCGSVEEVVENGITGFHVNARNDEDAISKAVDCILRLPELDRSRIRKVFERDWSSERMARQIDAAYKRCLAEPITILPGKRHQSNKWIRLFSLFK